MTENAQAALLGRLKKKSHTELLFLMEQLLDRKPDIGPLLNLLIELPFPDAHQTNKTPGKGNSRTLDLSSINKQLEAALRYTGGGYRSVVFMADELSRLSGIGDDFAEAGEWANAQAVYAAITGEAIPRYEELEDECQIAEVIDDCADGLAICLDAQRDLPEDERLSDTDRKALLTSLFEVWKFEQDYGGINTDVVDTIAHNVTNDERKMVEEWLQQELYAYQKSNRRTQSLENFLAQLQEGTSTGTHISPLE